MGSVIPNSDEKFFRIDVVGENNLKKIDLFRNGEHYTHFIPNGKTFKTEFAVKESELSNWYVRVTQLDNQLDRLSDENWRELIATYYGMISHADYEFGRV